MSENPLGTFRPTLYALVFLSLTGFCLAAGDPLIWVIGAAAMSVNAWMQYTGRLKPLSKLTASTATIVSLAITIYRLFMLYESPIIIVGSFLVLMQVVTLWDQRTNRDLTKLLLMSLLLMIAGAINTGSLLFGILLIVYLVLAVYFSILFYLKVEGDNAREGSALPETSAGLASPPGERQRFSRSMRRMTAIVTLASVASAVGVFLFFPRGSGANIIGPMQLRAAQRLTGFSEEVGYQNLARITQNQEVVGHVYAWEEGQPVEGTRPLLLRGMTLDAYTGGTSQNKPWTWFRSEKRESVRTVRAGRTTALGNRDDGGPTVRQRIVLEPTGTRVLFSLAGPMSISSTDDLAVVFTQADEVMQTVDRRLRRTEYEVISRDRPHPEAYQDVNSGLGRAPSAIDPLIGDYAARVAGELLAERTQVLTSRRFPGGPIRPMDVDGRIADRFARHLSETLSYTLDLTNSPNRDEDPIVTFLYKTRRGHCELFAGAMTLMCQSMGMEARMVIGFRTSEYNQVQGAYVVRQSHAHAWVEVLTPYGWVPFDPTSSRSAGGAPPPVRGMLSQMKDVVGYLQYLWGNNVVAFDNSNQRRISGNLNARITNNAVNTVPRLYERLLFWTDAGKGILGTGLRWGSLLLGVAGLGALAWWVRRTLRLRRRATRIGLTGLAGARRLQLAGQLRFYDDLVRVLDRSGVRRPPHQTPQEFGDSLAFLPATAYDNIRRLTKVFYRVRYGGEQLSPQRRRRLQNVVSKVAQTIETSGEPRARRSQNVEGA